MNRDIDDPGLDAEIRRFLQLRAEDTASVRNADEMVHALALRVAHRSPERDRTVRLAWVVVAAALLGALVASALFGGGRRQVLLVATATPGPTSTVAAPTPTLATSTPAIGEGPVLTWSKLTIDERLLKLPDPGPADRTTTRLAWLGDRFVLADEDAKAVSTSTDGRAWEVLSETDPGRDFYGLLLTPGSDIFGPDRRPEFATWDHDSLGWIVDSEAPPGDTTAPSVVQALRGPDGRVSKAEFEGKLGGAGIGPKGIVVRTHSTLDFDPFITSILGPEWVDRLDVFEFRDGILHITTTDGRSADIVWAEHGLKPGDVADRGFGWYSPDGKRWTPIPDFPQNVGDIVGVPDGFIARGVVLRDGSPLGTSMWHSTDGLTWRLLGGPADGYVIPWGGSALETDLLNRFAVWTGAGKRELPMAAELPANWTDSDKAIGAGSLGIVVVSEDAILFTPNGVDWSIQPMPDEMARDGGGRRATTVAIGERFSGRPVVVWDVGCTSPVSLARHTGAVTSTSRAGGWC